MNQIQLEERLLFILAELFGDDLEEASGDANKILDFMESKGWSKERQARVCYYMAVMTNEVLPYIQELKAQMN